MGRPRKNAEVLAFSQPRKLRPLLIPSGAPPVPIHGTVTPYGIKVWADMTREAYRKQGYFIKRRGLQYLLDNYFIDPNEHPVEARKVEKILATISDDMPE